MRSSRLLAFAVLALTTASSSSALAQREASGFGVERLTPAPAGGGWLVLDALDMRGCLGGAMAMTTSYAHAPLRVGGVKVVGDEALTDLGFAATLAGWRLSLDMALPLAIQGRSGTVGGVHFTAPNVDIASHPDTMTDARIGLDHRFFGDADAPLRLGASAQLYVPNGDRADYVTDDYYRAAFRALAAGDVGRFAYAAHVGVHVRPRDDSTTWGPRGSELLFAAAGGARFPLARWDVVVGPEILGATAFRSFFVTNATALEALLSARAETAGDEGPKLRIKLGIGPGITRRFGTPDWRAVVGIEVSNSAR